MSSDLNPLELDPAPSFLLLLDSCAYTAPLQSHMTSHFNQQQPPEAFNCSFHIVHIALNEPCERLNEDFKVELIFTGFCRPEEEAEHAATCVSSSLTVSTALSLPVSSSLLRFSFLICPHFPPPYTPSLCCNPISLPLTLPSSPLSPNPLSHVWKHAPISNLPVYAHTASPSSVPPASCRVSLPLSPPHTPVCSHVMYMEWAQ